MGSTHTYRVILKCRLSEFLVLFIVIARHFGTGTVKLQAPQFLAFIRIFNVWFLLSDSLEIESRINFPPAELFLYF